VAGRGPQRLLRTAGLTLLAAASAGWIAPLYLSASFLLYGLEKVKLADEPIQSFPFFPEARRMLLVALVWLAAAILFWSFVAGYRLFAHEES